MVLLRARSLGVFLVAFALPLVASAQKISGPRCPAGQRPSLSGCVDASAQARARARPAAEPKTVGPKPVPKPDPDVVVERAKPVFIEQKSKTLLIAELVRLEAMLKDTRENSPDYPVLVKRLADGYAELEMIAERERARNQAAADAEAEAARALERAKKPKKRGTGTVL